MVTFAMSAGCGSTWNSAQSFASSMNTMQLGRMQARPPATLHRPRTVQAAAPAIARQPPRITLTITAVSAPDVEAAEDQQSTMQVQPEQDMTDEEFIAQNFNVPDAVLERNAALAQELKGKLLLAPLTRGGNLPFRRLCMAHGCEATMSEMAFGKPLIKGDRVERARLMRAPEENCYGFQIATKVISEGVEAARLAKESGARWIDLNVGCPIYEASRRGLGAAMLRKPRSLAKLVHGIVKESGLPVTVKVRTGENEKKINVQRVAALLAHTGAAALTVHGRTMEQRYRKPADWSLVEEVAAAQPGLPVIGNGDILTHYDAARRLQGGQVHAVMSGRGALIRPWLFQELKLGRELRLSATDRVGVYRQLVSLMKSHFGDDAMGRRKAWYFLPWHFSFFHRYRPLPQEVYGEAAQQYPLILTRTDVCDPKVGEELDSLDPLERLLRCGAEDAHAQIAAALWDSASDSDAESALRQLAASKLLEWEEAAKGGAKAGDISGGGGSGVGGPSKSAGGGRKGKGGGQQGKDGYEEGEEY